MYAFPAVWTFFFLFHFVLCLTYGLTVRPKVWWFDSPTQSLSGIFIVIVTYELLKPLRCSWVTVVLAPIHDLSPLPFSWCPHTLFISAFSKRFIYVLGWKTITLKSMLAFWDTWTKSPSTEPPRTTVLFPFYTQATLWGLVESISASLVATQFP